MGARVFCFFLTEMIKKTCFWALGARLPALGFSAFGFITTRIKDELLYFYYIHAKYFRCALNSRGYNEGVDTCFCVQPNIWLPIKEFKTPPPHGGGGVLSEKITKFVTIK